LKNQGYNFSHNYGHGFKNLATILAAADDAGISRGSNPARVRQIIPEVVERTSKQEQIVGDNTKCFQSLDV
jgi:hypothetical protein